MTEEPPNTDPWESVRRKIASHEIPLTAENVRRLRSGTYRLPRSAVVTNEELADALEQNGEVAVPHEMRSFIAARLRSAVTPGLRGRRASGEALPEDARVVCGAFAACWSVHGQARGTRKHAIVAAAHITGKTTATVETILKNYWAKWRKRFPELVEEYGMNAVKNGGEN